MIAVAYRAASEHVSRWVYVARRANVANDADNNDELPASAASAPRADPRGPSDTANRVEAAVDENVQTIKA